MISSDRILTNERDTIDLVALFGVLWRYKYFIAAVGFALSLVAVVLALNATEIFRAEVVVTQVRDNSLNNIGSSLTNRLGGLASLAGVNLAQNVGPGADGQAVLESRRLVEEFIRRNNLVPVLLPSSSKRPPTVWLAVRQFREKVIDIHTDKDTGRTTLGIEWTDPVVAARWANGLVALTNELLRARDLAVSARSIDYLNKQMANTNVLEVQRVMYNLIEEQTKTQMLANAREEYAFTVVDPAVAPEVRARPQRTLMVLTGGVIGLLIGAALALAHNAWWPRRMQQRTAAAGAAPP